MCTSDVLDDCPKKRGIVIYGSESDDEIKGTNGADLIDCGKGKDVVREAQNADKISDSCEKVKNN